MVNLLFTLVVKYLGILKTSILKDLTQILLKSWKLIMAIVLSKLDPALESSPKLLQLEASKISNFSSLVERLEERRRVSVREEERRVSPFSLACGVERMRGESYGIPFLTPK